MTKPKRQYNRYSSGFKRQALLRAGEQGLTDIFGSVDTW